MERDDMDVQDRIRTIEADLKARRIPVAEFLDDIGVGRTSWQTWKNGRQRPSMSKWDKVEAGAARLNGQ